MNNTPHSDPAGLHELKLDVPFFDAAAAGLKPFEIRYDDRGYQKGDSVKMRAWWPAGEGFCYCSKRKPLKGVITYVTSFQQKEGWVVLGIKYEEVNDDR
jgi:hypothetical protein